MNLQTRYDLEIAEDKIAAKVERDVQPLETVAVRQCTKSPARKAPALRLPTVAKIQMFRVRAGGIAGPARCIAAAQISH
jgi:hypothetical protein